MPRLIFCCAAIIGMVPLVCTAVTVTAVSCLSPGAPFASAVDSCTALGSVGFAKSEASSNISLPVSASQAAVINAISTVSALQTTVRGMAATATATSSADIGVLFNTTGPVRDGLLEITFDQMGWITPSNGFIWESLNVASYSATSYGGSLQSVWIPIQLGTSFGFEYQQSISAISSSFNGLTNGQISSKIALLAFESDGVTSTQLFDPPGAVSFVPEPASMGLTVAACLFTGALMLKRRR